VGLAADGAEVLFHPQQTDVKRAMDHRTVSPCSCRFGAYYSGALTHLFFTDPNY